MGAAVSSYQRNENNKRGIAVNKTAGFIYFELGMEGGFIPVYNNNNNNNNRRGLILGTE